LPRPGWSLLSRLKLQLATSQTCSLSAMTPCPNSDISRLQSQRGGKRYAWASHSHHSAPLGPRQAGLFRGCAHTCEQCNQDGGADRRIPRSAQKCCNVVNTRGVTQRNAPLQRGISVEMGCVSQTAQSFERKEADRQPFVYTGAGAAGGYLPTGNLPIGALPTYGAGAGGGGSLRGRSAAAAALSIAKDAAAAVSIFSMM
jgi:hypothetical protein